MELEADRAFHGMVIADFIEQDGMLVGLEFVRASRCLPAGVLSGAERIDGENLGRRFRARLSPLLERKERTRRVH